MIGVNLKKPELSLSKLCSKKRKNEPVKLFARKSIVLPAKEWTFGLEYKPRRI